MAFLRFLFIASLCYYVYALELPAYIQRCKVADPDFNNCCKKTANEVISKIAEGVPAFGIPPLDPLTDVTANIETKNLNLHITKLSVGGLKGSQIKDYKMKYDEGDIQLNVFVPKLVLKGDYKVSGQILILPISGEGPLTLESEDVVINVAVKCSFYDKNGNQHMKCNTGKVTFTVKSGHIELGNLFGKEDVSKETNKVLNQNFNEVMKELAPAVTETIRSIADVIIQKFTEKASVKEMFLQ